MNSTLCIGGPLDGERTSFAGNLMIHMAFDHGLPVEKRIPEQHIYERVRGKSHGGSSMDIYFHESVPVKLREFRANEKMEGAR